MTTVSWLPRTGSTGAAGNACFTAPYPFTMQASRSNWELPGAPCGADALHGVSSMNAQKSPACSTSGAPGAISFARAIATSSTRGGVSQFASALPNHGAVLPIARHGAETEQCALPGRALVQYSAMMQ